MADSPQRPESESFNASESPGHAAPSPRDLEKAAENIPEGPNIEADPGAADAARGKVPLEGPRAGEQQDQPPSYDRAPARPRQDE